MNRRSVLGFLAKPDAVYDTPDVSSENDGEELLEDSKGQSSTVEFFASAGRDHCAESAGEWNAVEDTADHGQGRGEFHN